MSAIPTFTNNPVDVDVFVQKTKMIWCEEIGNISSHALETTWAQNANAMNCVVRNNIAGRRPIKHVIAAPTGSGKTLSTIIYCSMLEKDIKVLVVTKLIREAERLAAEINVRSADDRALAVFGHSTISQDEILHAQVLICTHQMYYKHHSKEHWVYSDHRSLIIIDEALETIEQHYITSVELDDVIRQVEYLSIELGTDKIKNAYEVLMQFSNKIKSSPEGKSFNLVMNFSNEVVDLLAEGSFDAVITEIQRDAYYPIGIARSSSRAVRKNSIRDFKEITLIKVLGLVSRSNNFTVYANDKNIFFVNEVPHRHSLIVFDATGDVARSYEIRSDHRRDVRIVPKIENTRRYDHVTIKIATTLTGASHFRDIEKIENIISNVEFGQRTLFVVHKDNKHVTKMNKSQEPFTEALAKYGYKKTYGKRPEDVYEYANLDTGQILSITHWGNITGLNDWSDYDTCVLFGLFHKPLNVARDQAISCTNVYFAFDDANQMELDKSIESSELLAEVVQAINRIRVRKTIDQNGNCDAANIYVMLDFHGVEEMVEKLRSSMPGCSISDWDGVKVNKKSAQRKDYFAEIIKPYLINEKSSIKSSDLVKMVYGEITPRAKNRVKEILKKNAQEIASLGYHMLEERIYSGRRPALELFLICVVDDTFFL
ncbi:MAG: DEAD/DEAH box helicase [Campylobacterales bacterium]|nr:DEAD/DEAH box helicase [Campylobacterales bacterium]